MSHLAPQPATISGAKHSKIPRPDVARPREVLDVVNGYVRRPGRILTAKNRVREALSRLIESCDAIEQAPETPGTDNRDFARLSTALEPVRGRLAKVRLFPNGTPGGSEAVGRGRARVHRFRVTEDLMQGQDAEDELYLAFA
jgi:hypothetical protein